MAATSVVVPESAFTPFTPAFDSLVEKVLKRWHIPGASFSVIHKDSTWSKGYGLADVDSNVPVDPSRTIFYGASTTKAQLAAGWALYIASDANKSKPKDQQIAWSTPLARIIPEDFVLSDPIRTMQVTLEDCLSHRTGLSRHDLIYGWEGARTVKVVTRSLRHLPLTSEIRTKFEYCNTPFVAASHALETVMGKPLSQILRESLWQPLGMERTYGGHGEETSGDDIVATPYTWSRSPADPECDSGKLVREDKMDLSYVSGAGYVMSTAEDYAKWMRAFLDPSKGPLSKDIIKEVWKPRSFIPREEGDGFLVDGIISYGLGWFSATYKSHNVYYHAGGVTGAGALVMLVPSLNFGVTFFANGADCANKLQGLSFELISTVMGFPGQDSVKSADESVMNSYKKMKDEYASSRSRIYPNAPPSPSVPPAVALEDYTGVYSNPVFGEISLTLYHGSSEYDAPDRLVCKVFDRTWRRILVLAHVNGEHWLVTELSGATSEAEKTGDSPYKSAYKAQTRVGTDGKVEAVGLAWEPGLPSDMAWFEHKA